MTKIHHLNCVMIQSPIGVHAIGHCLLLEDGNELALVDAGIGLLETQHPNERLGKELIDIVGFKFDKNQTAIVQIEQMGIDPSQVNHCIVTHLDPDHIGGLVDFLNLEVHVAKEEYENFNSGNPRYLPIQLAHQPKINVYNKSEEEWFGLEARKVEIGFESTIYLIPLFGHTLGHCGVAIQQANTWVLHAGDAYYLREELTSDEHPVSQFAASRADDNQLRIRCLQQIRGLISAHPEIEILGYHDPKEFNP